MGALSRFVLLQSSEQRGPEGYCFRNSQVAGTLTLCQGKHQKHVSLFMVRRFKTACFNFPWLKFAREYLSLHFPGMATGQGVGAAVLVGVADSGRAGSF
jgi:hypothetical protein